MTLRYLFLSGSTVILGRKSIKISFVLCKDKLAVYYYLCLKSVTSEK